MASQPQTSLQIRAAAELELRRRKAAVWVPLPKQQQAIESPAFELLYGGSAGGGKTLMLLGMAWRHHHSSLLLRRTYPELEDSLIAASKPMYIDGRYNGHLYAWRFDDGRRIRFGHMESDDAVGQYQSAEFDLIGFDELSHFSQFQYEYLLSRARTSRKGQRVRIVGCTNPGGPGHEWVVKRWAAWLDKTHSNPAQAGELRWYKRLADGTEVETQEDDPDALSRTFIPARLSDNPYLDDSYRRNLMLLPEPYRSQLLYGDWDAGTIENAYAVIQRGMVRQAIERWREWDAAGRWGKVTHLGVDVGGGSEQGDKSTIAIVVDGHIVSELRVIDVAQDALQATMELAGQVAGLIQKHRSTLRAVTIDVMGIGAGVVARLVEQGYNITPFVASRGTGYTDSSGELGFANWRAAGWWMLREALDPGSGLNIALPPDDTLTGELTAPTHKIISGGKIQVEEKASLRRSLKRSTDCADAVIHALVGPLLAREQQAPRREVVWRGAR